MPQLHLLPDWDDSWAVLSLWAHLEHAPPDRHHVVAWHTGSGGGWFSRDGVSTSVLYRRWSWDPIALWRWGRLLRRENWQAVHLWGGWSQGAAPTLAMVSAERVFLHVLRSGDLNALLHLERRAAPPRQVSLPRPWFEEVRKRLTTWEHRLEATQATWPPFARSEAACRSSSPEVVRRLQRLLAGQGAMVLGYDDGRSLQRTRDLLWAADILCTAWPERLRVCFTGPRPPRSAALRFWDTLRTRQNICWLPWPLVLGEVLPRAQVLWWNDAEDLTLLLPRAAVDRGLAVLGWTGSLAVLDPKPGREVAVLEQDPYALASATHAALAHHTACPPHG